MKPSSLSSDELLIFVRESGIRVSMAESTPNLILAVEQEEARLLAEWAKLVEVKRVLGMPASSLAPPPPAAPPVQKKPEAEPQPAPSASLNEAAAFDGSFKSLIDCYHQHPKSPYHQLKHNVRSNYDNTFKRIINDVGDERISDWNADHIRQLHEKNWAADGKFSMGHMVIAKLRLLSTFGSVTLNDDACMRLSAILGNMRFARGKAKDSGERLTRDHVRAIRVAAREHFGWDSIALAQAFQLEFPKLKQMDIIGEWVPLNEPGTSDIVKGNEKWVRGLRWSDIDENMVLRRVLTSGRRDQHKEVTFNLKRSAMVIEEINRIPVEKRKGAMIICEYSNIPWSAAEFRRKWRIVATKAGVPESLSNGTPIEDGDSELGAEKAL
jgi:hypothetical protein